VEPIVVSDRVVVPAHALSFRAVRASGPGGQNVNKVSSKVELRVDLDAIVGLLPEQRRRLESIARRRLDASGGLFVASQRTRSQAQNLEEAREKIRELVLSALTAPKPRRPTKPTRASRIRRVEEKRRLSQKKESRRLRDD
jgi:ribosome-associated protein